METYVIVHRPHIKVGTCEVEEEVLDISTAKPQAILKLYVHLAIQQQSHQKCWQMSFYFRMKFGQILRIIFKHKA